MCESMNIAQSNMSNKRQLGCVANEAQTFEALLHSRGGFEQPLVNIQNKMFDNTFNKLLKGSQPLFNGHATLLDIL